MGIEWRRGRPAGDQVTMTDAATTPPFLGLKCPTCGMSWWLFRPAKIYGEPKVRCVECKDVFDASILGEGLSNDGAKQ